MSLKLHYHPDPCLRQVCKHIPSDPGTIKDVVSRMIDIMESTHGQGLAAPQVGLDWRLFITRWTLDTVYIDPVIESADETIVDNLEGCLSLPGPRVKVPRLVEVKISYKDIYLQPKTRTLIGGGAFCVQHEIDHLDGVLIYDYIKSKVMKRLFLDKVIKNVKKL